MYYMLTNDYLLAIETRGLRRDFGPIRAVENLSLHVPRGSIYGFLGPNGAGKTTTIRMLLGLMRPDQGEIRLFGTLVTRASQRAALCRIGAMVETPSLYPHLTGYENLRITQELLDLDRSGIDQVLRIVRMERDARRLVGTYSHGMRQRLGLALALLPDPELLMSWDEPTDGLDPAGIHEMRDLVRGFPVEHGITVFLSSHLLAEVEQMASHVGIIGRGLLIFEGALSHLQSRQRKRVLIEVDRPSEACAALRGEGWTVEVVDGASGAPTLTVDLSDRADIAHAATLLLGLGLRLYELHEVKPSLEELFLDLTSGANLASPSPEAPAVALTGAGQ